MRSSNLNLVPCLSKTVRGKVVVKLEARGRVWLAADTCAAIAAWNGAVNSKNDGSFLWGPARRPDERCWWIWGQGRFPVACGAFSSGAIRQGSG